MPATTKTVSPGLFGIQGPWRLRLDAEILEDPRVAGLSCGAAVAYIFGVFPHLRARVLPHLDELIAAGLVVPDEAKEWRYADPGRHVALTTNTWSRHAYAEVRRRDGGTCRYCGATERLTIDHVVPRAQGGGDEADNLVVACWPCNSRKRARTPEQAGMVLRLLES